MSILFIPNDPEVTDQSPVRSISPSDERQPGQAGFTYAGEAAEAEYPQGSAEFLFWQTREGALRALQAWEELDTPVTSWANRTPRLFLRQNAGADLNAFYDRKSLSFFEFRGTEKITFSGASTDVVSHEAGHALLDSIRPDLWGSFFTEVNALHEGFADCVAILTALSDRNTRQTLLDCGALDRANFVEATAEDLSHTVRVEFGADHPAAEPRHAFNDFAWQLPSSLPASGPPGTLSREIHSFGRVFSGAFYDTLHLIFKGMGEEGEEALAAALKIAGGLLITGIRSAVETPRFFQSVGSAMILTDRARHQGAHEEAIRTAFGRHNLVLEGSATVAPTAALSGRQPELEASSILTSTTRKDVLLRIDAPPDASLAIRPLDIGEHEVACAVHRRQVFLGGLDRRLSNVVVRAAESILVGSSGSQAAILGRLPEQNTTAEEVHKFVESLLENGQISFPGTKTPRPSPPTTLPTHAIRKRGEFKALLRMRYE